MRFNRFINESDKNDIILYGKSLDPIVKKVWEKYFKNAYASSGKTAMNRDEYNLYGFHYGNSSKEFTNGISQNDPLNFRISVDISDSGYIVEFQANSITIEPDTKYMAFSSHKVNVRKFRAKTTKDFEKKFGNAVKKFSDATKQVLADGKLDVHGEDIVKMIKKKLK